MEPDAIRVSRRREMRFPGRRLLNFYFSDTQRLRFLAAPRNGALVIAAPAPDMDFFFAALRPLGADPQHLFFTAVTRDWHRSLAAIFDAVLHVQRQHTSVRVLADFAGEVHQAAVFELESLLGSGLREWNVACATQYAARGLGAIDAVRLARFGTVLVGDYYHRKGTGAGKTQPEVPERAGTSSYASD
jgi:hypothetical protein